MKLPGGTIHARVPNDLLAALNANSRAQAAWGTLTPLARNEWICWVENAKLINTRTRRIERTASEIADGIRRHCYWIGCVHRTDKKISSSVKALMRRQK